MTDRPIPLDDADPGRESNGRRDDGSAPRDGFGATGGGRTRRSLLSATGSALAAALAGCVTNPWGPESGSASDGDTRAPSDDASGTAPSSDATETTGEDTERPPPLEREPAQVVAVAPDGFRFDPESFEIDAGETVHWRWEDSGHNLRVREKPDGSDWEGTPGTASDTYDEGYEHAHTFDAPGEYRYFCAPHQTLGLEGTFTVR